MAGQFAAFSFVDRITGFTPGIGAHGEFAVPAALAAFPCCLVAEAVGQLAAWVAMAQVDFRSRPVAALAREIRLHGDVVPGSVLALSVEIDRCDDDAIAYTGRATSGDGLAIELVDCVGPMLPATQFDAPGALAEHLALLRGPGAPAGRFHGLPEATVVHGQGGPGHSRTAELQVPTTAPFFGDHFPRRPVYPGTLLLDALMRLGLELATAAPDLPAGTRPAPVRLTHVKLRSFVAPGDVLALDAQRASTGGGAGQVVLTARGNGKVVATARLQYSPRTPG
jgi:3-hydroxyacyl-[acyl-carrier-protein] dehydratase